MVFRNYRQNPYTLELEPVYIHPDSYTGYKTITVPGTPNEPEINPNRIEAPLLEIPYRFDPVNKPVLLYVDSITDGNKLRAVDGEPIEDNTYRLANQGAERPHVVQFSPNLITKTIYPVFWGIGSILDAEELINLAINSITCNQVNTENIKANKDIDCRIINSHAGNFSSQIKVGGTSFDMSSIFREANDSFMLSNYNITNSISTSIRLEAFGTKADTQTSTYSAGFLDIDAGHIHTPAGGSSNLLTVSNKRNYSNAGTVFILKANGDLHTVTHKLMPIYDSENDIRLVEALRKEVANKFEDTIFDEYRERLESLGIIENGFLSHSKKDALLLGSVGQLFKMISKIAGKLNLSENDLFEMAIDKEIV